MFLISFSLICCHCRPVLHHYVYTDLYHLFYCNTISSAVDKPLDNTDWYIYSAIKTQIADIITSSYLTGSDAACMQWKAAGRGGGQGLGKEGGASCVRLNTCLFSRGHWWVGRVLRGWSVLFILFTRWPRWAILRRLQLQSRQFGIFQYRANR